MMRTPLIEFNAITPGAYRRPEPQRDEVRTEKGSFTITQRPLRHIFELNSPQVIYTFRFASDIASSLAQGKTVEVKCDTNSFLAQELKEDASIKQDIEDTFRQLHKPGNKYITVEEEYSRQPGLLGYVRKSNISVVFRAKTITIPLSP